MRRVTVIFLALVAQLACSFVLHARPGLQPVKPLSVDSLERTGVVLMAVPKKRQSKMKTRQRKAKWFSKADMQSARALALGRSVLKGSDTTFVYVDKKDDDEDDDVAEIEEEEEEEDDDDDDESN